MLCGVALHHELAELRAEVGPQVFDDPVAFRAAFDDFVAEGSASTGEVSLLVGAIATGALQRLREQLALGADPETSIAVQADLLARDRGTTESSGARWALSVLAHAMGAVPAEQVPTRPTPSPDSTRTAGRPPAAVTSGDVLDPGPTHGTGHPPTVPGTGTHPAPVADQQPPTFSPVGPAERRTTPILLGVVLVLAIVAVTAIVLLVLRDDDSPDDTADNGSTASDGSGSPGEEPLAELEMSAAGKTVRVELVRDGTDAYLLLLVPRDGDYVEVGRAPTACPYLDTSYAPGINDQGGGQISWGWQNNGTEGYGAYGEVLIDEEMLISFEDEDTPCPYTG